MARLASCLVLISLCLCIVIEPTLAAKKGLNKKRRMVFDPVFEARKGLNKISMVKPTMNIAPLQAPIQFNVLPPASAPFPVAVPSEYEMAQQLCQDSKQPELCHKIINGGKIDPVTEAKVTIEITSSMASRASAYMSKISSTRKDLAPGALNSCMLSYKKAINALNLSYTNFQTNPKNAMHSLRIADYQVRFCTASLGQKNEIPPVVKANKAMQGMIQAIRSVAKKQLN